MPRIDILTHNLPDSETALRVEAAVIDAVGRKNLANQIGGWNSVSYGRMTLERIKVLYDAQPIDFAEIREPVLLIRINQLFRYDMTPLELYEATRGVWNLNLERASTVRLVFAVYEGIVQEAYRAAAWFPGGTTAYFKRPKENVDAAERCEFVGNIAEPEIRDKYVGRQVGPLFVAGARSPVKYVEPSVG